MTVSLVALAAAGALLYAPVAAGLVRQWLTDDISSYGLLVVAAAAFAWWQRRAALRQLSPAPSARGLPVVMLAMTLFLVGGWMGEIVLQRVSLPLALAGVVLSMAGPAHLRASAAPLLLLALSIPLPMVLVTWATLPLQLMASQVAAGVLEAVQIPVVRQGNLLTLPRVTLEVADACSGLRSLVSLTAIGAVAGAVLPIGAWRTAAVLAAAVPIALLGNGLRVAATGILATMFGEGAARGTVHDLTGYVAFIVMGAATLAVLPLTRSRAASTAADAERLAGPQAMAG